MEISEIISVEPLFEFLVYLMFHLDFVDVMYVVVLFGWKVEITDKSIPDESSATTCNKIEVFKSRA